MSSLSALEELVQKLRDVPAAEISALSADVEVVVKPYKFIPSPGPQTDAYYSKADILLYGGQPGGGKTGLLIGLALNEHSRSLIVRRQFADLQGVVDNAKGIVGSSEGFVGGGRPLYRKPDGGVIAFEGISDLVLDTGKQGNARDFIGVDEGAQLPETAIRMLYGWNRTPKRNGQPQRCRMVIASNPPLDSTGEWMVEFFAPWLDDKYPAPAKPGELRYFIFNENDKSEEVPSKEPVERNGRTYYPHSRTFIPSSLADNPFLDATEYRSRLDAMPEPFRSILLTGNFLLGRRDQDRQLIPTNWVREAMARWTSTPPPGVPMCSIGVDPACGGADETILAPRYDGWFAELIAVPGEKTPHGHDVVGLAVQHRRDNALLVIDMGGGYGGGVAQSCNDNNIPYKTHNGACASTSRTRDGAKLPFVNKRAEVYWRFREALDPAQPGGSPIALPPSPKLLADLTVLTFEPTARGIKLIQDKDKVKALLGRSPDRGDAVVMAWSAGDTVATHQGGWEKGRQSRTPSVVDAYAHRRRR